MAFLEIKCFPLNDFKIVKAHYLKHKNTRHSLKKYIKCKEESENHSYQQYLEVNIDGIMCVHKK
jgi:hypothetical protein